MIILSLQECQKISGNGKGSQIVAGSLGAISLGYVAGKVTYPFVGWSVCALLLSMILSANLLILWNPNEMNS